MARAIVFGLLREMERGSQGRTASRRFDGEVSPTVLLAVNLSRNRRRSDDAPSRQTKRRRDSPPFRVMLARLL